MPHSYAQTASLTCPQCGQPVDLEIWLIVDTAARPDLTDRVREGTLHAARCPHCDHAGGVDAPLLIHDPDRDPPLLFSPAQNTTAEQDREHAAGLLDRLRKSLDDAWQDNWLVADLPGIPRPLLPAVLEGGDPQTAMEAALAQVQQEVERLQEEDPNAYAQLEAAARTAVAPLSPEGEGDVQRMDAVAIADLLIAWIETPDWSTSEEYLRAHAAELLTDQAEILIGQLVEVVQAQEGQRAAQAFQQHCILLRRAREIGVELAYREFRAALSWPKSTSTLNPAQID